MWSRGHLIIILLTLTVLASPLRSQWLMKGHNPQRTGQSLINGPTAVTDSWVYEAPGAFVINIGATVTNAGAFFGSWGLLRNDSLGRDARFWDKSDGKFYGLDIQTGQPLWNNGSMELDLTHRCYEFEGRERTGDDLFWCGISPYHVSFYNGTVEGQAAFDPSRNVIYLGRGDGKLYAIDPDAGVINWRFKTFNPQLPEDPDGGGELISSPVIGDDGTVYVGSWGIGPNETNAFYAINPDSTLKWRFPSDSSITDRPIFTSPALSLDNSTIYWGTFFDGDKDIPGRLFALNLAPSGMIPDDQRLKWQITLTHLEMGVWTTTVAVGSDGIIYVGGLTLDSDGGTNVPVVFAIEDSPGSPAFKWTQQYTELRDGAQWTAGIALRETGGGTHHVYAVTSNFRANILLPLQREQGTLFAIDPATGNILADYDPSDDVPAAVGGLNSPAIGADGVIYFGVRGKFETNTVEPVTGHVFAVKYHEVSSSFQKIWNFEIDRHLEWNNPAIGPDGGIYVSSSIGSFSDINTYDQGFIPPSSTCKFYAIKGTSNPVSVDKDKRQPDGFVLKQNYQNPFNPQTTIGYTLTRPGHVRLEIFDLKGRSIQVLVEKWQSSGHYEVHLDSLLPGSDGYLASGLYIYELKYGNASLRKKMILMH